jgi:hypothetical protein
LLRLIAGDPSADIEILSLARTSHDVPLLVAAALLSGDTAQLERAAAHSRTPRHRQLVALAEAHLRGDDNLFGALVREHLVDHPDSLLASWLAGAAH